MGVLQGTVDGTLNQKLALKLQGKKWAKIF
jgi:hypothetical protein